MAGVLANLAFPLLIIGGLAFLQRRNGGMGGPGGMNPLDIGKSKSKIQMEPQAFMYGNDVAEDDGFRLGAFCEVEFLGACSSR